MKNLKKKGNYRKLAYVYPINMNRIMRITKSMIILIMIIIIIKAIIEIKLKKSNQIYYIFFTYLKRKQLYGICFKKLNLVQQM